MMIMTGCGLSQQELSEAVTEATSLETTSAVMESDEADTTSETYSVSEESKEENVPLTYTDVVPGFQIYPMKISLSMLKITYIPE